jgi:hypothetical protein
MKELPPCEEREGGNHCVEGVPKGSTYIVSHCNNRIENGQCLYYELVQIIRVKKHRNHPLAEGTMYWAEGEE